MGNFNFNQFIRIAKVEVSVSNEDGTNSGKKFSYYFPDADIVFKVGKSSGRKYIQGNCKIYGTNTKLANAVNNGITNKVKSPSFITLYAGRGRKEENLRKVFEGTIESVSYRFDGGNQHTEIVFSHHVSKLLNEKLQFTVNKSASISDIVGVLASKIHYKASDGSTKDYSTYINIDKSLDKVFKTRTQSGTVGQILQKIIPSDSRLEWNIVGREIRVNSKYSTTNRDTYTVTHKTGLETKPTPSRNGYYKFKMRITPEITTGTQIRIPSHDSGLSHLTSNGNDTGKDFIFKVVEFEHNFSESTDSTEVECVLLQPNKNVSIT